MSETSFAVLHQRLDALSEKIDRLIERVDAGHARLSDIDTVLTNQAARFVHLERAGIEALTPIPKGALNSVEIIREARGAHSRRTEVIRRGAVLFVGGLIPPAVVRSLLLVALAALRLLLFELRVPPRLAPVAH
jgi:hypothetical protein